MFPSLSCTLIQTQIKIICISAYPVNNGFIDLLEGNKMYPLARDKWNLLEDERKERKSYEKLNQVVYGTLLYAVDDEISFNAVNTAILDRFLNGCARTAWKKIEDEMGTINNDYGIWAGGSVLPYACAEIQLQLFKIENYDCYKKLFCFVPNLR